MRGTPVPPRSQLQFTTKTWLDLTHEQSRPSAERRRESIVVLNHITNAAASSISINLSWVMNRQKFNQFECVGRQVTVFVMRRCSVIWTMNLDLIAHRGIPVTGVHAYGVRRPLYRTGDIWHSWILKYFNDNVTTFQPCETFWLANFYDNDTKLLWWLWQRSDSAIAKRCTDDWQILSTKTTNPILMN